MMMSMVITNTMMKLQRNPPIIVIVNQCCPTHVYEAGADWTALL